MPLPFAGPPPSISWATLWHPPHPPGGVPEPAGARVQRIQAHHPQASHARARQRVRRTAHRFCCSACLPCLLPSVGHPPAINLAKPTPTPHKLNINSQPSQIDDDPNRPPQLHVWGVALLLLCSGQGRARRLRGRGGGVAGRQRGQRSARRWAQRTLGARVVHHVYGGCCRRSLRGGLKPICHPSRDTPPTPSLAPSRTTLTSYPPPPPPPPPTPSLHAQRPPSRGQRCALAAGLLPLLLHLGGCGGGRRQARTGEPGAGACACVRACVQAGTCCILFVLG